MRIEKVAGEDNKVLEFIKYREQEVKQWVLDLFRQIWKEGTIPKVWERNIITRIHKKNDSHSDAESTAPYAVHQ